MAQSTSKNRKKEDGMCQSDFFHLLLMFYSVQDSLYKINLDI